MAYRSLSLLSLLGLSLTATACGSTESEDLGGGFIKPPHFVDSFPAQGTQFVAVPKAVVVNFNFDLHRNDTRAWLERDGVSVPVKTTVAEDQLSLRIDPLGASEPGGYVVGLDACWPDGSCHPGQFVFTVDPGLLPQYKDLTGQNEVTVRMANIAFDQPMIVVKSGTKVTWVNDEDPIHYINSDPHPSHNVLPELNSKAMARGAAYSFVFDRPGEWSYHCSAHPEMKGRVLVMP